MTTRSTRLTCTCALAAAVSLGGCAGSKDGRGAPAAADANRAPVDRRFETSRDPSIHPETRYAAGELAEGRGAFAAAAEQYRQALRRNPNHLPSLYRLGVVYAEMRKFPDGIDVWKRYIAATDGSAAGYSNLAFCYELAGRPQDAEGAYARAIGKDPRHVASRVNYGLMLVRLGREGEARLHLQAVLQPAEVHYNVGSAYESLGRPEQAKAEYAKALQLDPAFTDARTRLAEMNAPASPPAPASSRDALPAPTGMSRTE